MCPKVQRWLSLSYWCNLEYIWGKCTKAYTGFVSNKECQVAITLYSVLFLANKYLCYVFLIRLMCDQCFFYGMQLAIEFGD